MQGGGKVSERVRLMKENFMQLHNQGYTIPEIAKKYNLGRATVYQHLQEIADANGVSRESLLQQVKKPYENGAVGKYRRVQVDMKALEATFEEVEAGLQFISEELGKILEEE